MLLSTSPQQRLGAAGAAVIIVIVVTAAALNQLSPGNAPVTPAGVLTLLAAAGCIGVLTVRLAVTGFAGPLRTLAARILAVAMAHS
ncbi:hypothetical protein ACWC0C_41300 [Streptomyces sp. NPDC001709]